MKKLLSVLLLGLALTATAQTTVHYSNNSASLEANLLLYGPSPIGLIDVAAGIPPGTSAEYTFNYEGPATLQVIDIFGLFQPAQIEVYLVPGETIYVDITSEGDQLQLTPYTPKRPGHKPKKLK